MTWHDMKHHANDRYLKYLNKGWDHDKLRSSDNNYQLGVASRITMSRDSDADNFRKKMFAMSAKEQQIKSKINREKLEYSRRSSVRYSFQYKYVILKQFDRQKQFDASYLKERILKTKVDQYYLSKERKSRLADRLQLKYRYVKLENLQNSRLLQVRKDEYYSLKRLHKAHLSDIYKTAQSNRSQYLELKRQSSRSNHRSDSASFCRLRREQSRYQNNRNEAKLLAELKQRQDRYAYKAAQGNLRRLYYIFKVKYSSRKLHVIRPQIISRVPMSKNIQSLYKTKYKYKHKILV